MYEDLSVNPDISKRIFLSTLERIVPKKLESNNWSCQLDLAKIKHIFLQANLKDKEIEILTVLKALKNRYNKSTSPVKRR